MQKTKIEVLLDKMHLVLDEADAILDEVDKRLLAKYAAQITALLNAGENDRQERQRPPADKEQKPAPPTDQPASEQSTTPGQHNDSAEQQRAPDNPQVDPLTEAPAGTSSFSFVDGETDDNDTNEDSGKKATEKEQKAPPHQVHEQIYKDLEEIKKNRESTGKLVNDDDAEDDDNEDDAPLEEENPSVNDRFRQPDSDIVDHLKATPIRNLQQEIDLNDKFWFINELFEGDAATFNELLAELDALHSFEDAREVIHQKAAQKFSWQENDRAVQKFYQVVSRRYL